MDIPSLDGLGLNPTQLKVYTALLATDRLTPVDLAKQTALTRTNAYELLRQLEELGLVEKDASGAKTAYRAKSPMALKVMLAKQQQELKRKSEALESVLPHLLSTYRLTQEQPGVLYLEGQTGLTNLFDDIIRQQEELLILPSAHDRDNEEVAQAIDTQIKRQVAAKIPCRVIYPEEEQLDSAVTAQLKKQLIEVRYFGHASFAAQIMIYANNVAYSTYRHGVVTTIITNPDIATTMRFVFEGMWAQAQSPTA